METTKKVGQTKDSGFQIGVRRTFPISLSTLWDFLFSDEGLKIWLGKISLSEFEANSSFHTVDGIEGVVRLYKPLSHIRLTWKKKGWKNFSSLQIRVIDNKGKSTVSFHQDKLLNSTQREEMKAYWDRVLGKISEKIRVEN